MKACPFISCFVGKVAAEEEVGRWVVLGLVVAQDVATPTLSFMYVEC